MNIKSIVFQSDKCIHFPYRNLDDNQMLSNFREPVNFKKFDIYFLCKTPKIRFYPESFNFSKGIVEFKLKSKGTEEYVQTKIKELIEYRVQEKISIQEEDLYLEIDEEMSSNKDIFVDVFEKGKKRAKMGIPLELVDDYLEIKPEIIYIGKSIDVVQRLRKHEKIVKINSKIDDDEEMRIYLLSFYVYSEGYLNEKADNNIGKGKSSIIFQNRLELVERLLINYFRPRFNEHYVNMELNQDKVINTNLISNGINEVKIKLHGNKLTNRYNTFKFWSESKIKCESIINLKF